MESQTQGEAGAERADSGAYPGAGAEAGGRAELSEEQKDASLRRAEKAGPIRNATELLERASESFCITWQVVEFAVWHRRQARPWKWKQAKRVPLEKRQISMTRGEVLRATFVKEKPKMLTVTGTAEFKEDGKVLETTLIVQPHFPVEHDMLAKVAKLYSMSGVSLENGQLVIRRPYFVADAHPVPENIALSADEGEPAAQGGEPGGEQVSFPENDQNDIPAAEDHSAFDALRAPKQPTVVKED